MDIFRVLSRGAYVNKNKHNQTIIGGNKPSETSRNELGEEIEKELDFFHSKSSKPQTEEIKPAEKSETPQENTTIEDVDDLTVEEARVLRKSHNAKIQGDDVALPLKNFENMVTRYSINDRMFVKNLKESGFSEPTPIQSEAIPIIMSDRDLVACGPTGSGKTLAFIVPVVVKIMKLKREKTKGIKCLVISPTKELAVQLYNVCVSVTKGLEGNVTCKLLSKSLSSRLRNDNVTTDKIDILIATPTRLVDLISHEKISLRGLKFLVFDEADKLFEGDFLGQVDSIIDNSKEALKLMFSATIPSHVEEIAKTIMNEDCVRLIIGNKQAANQNIDQKLVFCGSEEGKLLEVRNMVLRGEIKPPVIIFLQSIVRAKALFHELLYENLKIDMIHSDKTSFQRNQIIERFKQGDIWVLICTDVLARGIDFKHVNLVINYDVPVSSSSYIHRIGRTGRNGNKGTAVTLYTQDDVVALKSIINVMKESNTSLEKWMDNLGKVSKRDKKKLKRHEIERKKISTVPGVVVHKRKMKRHMIEDSKRRREN